MPDMQCFTGHVLLAMPSQTSEPFADGVLLICQHDEQGSMGLMLNKLQKISVRDVLADLQLDILPGATDAVDVASYSGGPVDPFRGFILHDSWNIYESTMQVTPEIHLTSSRDVLEAIAKGEGPEHFRLLLGYAGWSAGQLEQELVDNAWLLVPPNPSLLFHTDTEQQWDVAAQSIGVTKSHLSMLTGHS